ncbi:RIMS-binding protein 2, partial [Galemys pyrenaicus]
PVGACWTSPASAAGSAGSLRAGQGRAAAWAGLRWRPRWGRGPRCLPVHPTPRPSQQRDGLERPAGTASASVDSARGAPWRGDMFAACRPGRCRCRSLTAGAGLRLPRHQAGTAGTARPLPGGFLERASGAQRPGEAVKTQTLPPAAFRPGAQSESGSSGGPRASDPRAAIRKACCPVTRPPHGHQRGRGWQWSRVTTQHPAEDGAWTGIAGNGERRSVSKGERGGLACAHAPLPLKLKRKRGLLSYWGLPDACCRPGKARADGVPTGCPATPGEARARPPPPVHCPLNPLSPPPALPRPHGTVLSPQHMREAAGRRQQLELEHEQALAVLTAKQQEIDLLQKAQVEAKKEHEGAVQLLESKVQQLEEQCRAQSEQFGLLSRDLEVLRRQAGGIDLLGGLPPALRKPFLPFMNGLAASIGQGHESTAGAHTVIGDLLRPLPLPGDEPLPARPAFLPRSSSPRCRFEADMDNDRSPGSSKQRYSGKVHLCVARYSKGPSFPQTQGTPRALPAASQRGRGDTVPPDCREGPPSATDEGCLLLSYNPFDGPNENPEAELPLTAGKYLYIYGDMDEDGFYEGELLDGQRGLVPSNFVDFVQDSESRLGGTLGSEQDQNLINHSGLGLEGERILDLHSPTHTDLGAPGDTGDLEASLDDAGEDTVPYPRKITLIKQLAKSVIVGWEPPAVPPGWGAVSSYTVLVDTEPRLSLALGARTKALVEKLNLAACTHRISVQCVTSRGSSDELRCTLLVGRDVVVAPSHLRVDNITQISAQLSWLPTNSNYSHVIFLNEEELDMVKAARYKYQFFNLRPNMAYKVRVLAKPHQMPWQLPLEQREKKEAFVEFSTLPAVWPCRPLHPPSASPAPAPFLATPGQSSAASGRTCHRWPEPVCLLPPGPPAPPQDVTVQAGTTPATVLVSWKPPAMTSAGLSNGASVTGYGVFARGQRVAELIAPMADSTAVELARLHSLDAKALTVRTLSAQGESVDSALAAIPPDLLVPPPPHPRAVPTPKPLASAGAPETKDEHLGPHVQAGEGWEQGRAPPAHGRTLELPAGPGRRSPSPSRILPQPQGAPVSTSVAKAMAREAAQRVAESSRSEKRSVFLERSSGRYADSDEEDGYCSPEPPRRGTSVDDFLRGSELGKQPHCCHGDEHHTESSRGSDLSDILEEDEEDLYSEMQLEDGGRRRPSGTSHNALKDCPRPWGPDGAFLEQPEHPCQAQHSKKLFSIPEVAEEDGEPWECWHRPGAGGAPRAQARRPSRPGWEDVAPQGSWPPAISRAPGAGPHTKDPLLEDRTYRFGRWATRSPDSGLDCGSEEEESRFSFRRPASLCGPGPGPCPCRRGLRPLLARRRTLTRQSSIEEDFGEPGGPGDTIRSNDTQPSPERPAPGKDGWDEPPGPGAIWEAWKSSNRVPGRGAAGRSAQPPTWAAEGPGILGNPASAGRADRVDPVGRRLSHGGVGAQRSRPVTGPAIDDYGGREGLSPDFYEESDTDPGTEELPARVFVALFDYDPLTMSPNPDAAEEELPFKEGQVIKVYGDKDADGFYRGETCARLGLIPCNMVSEIQADDEEMVGQLLRQGFLPLNTPVEKIERRRGGRRHSASTGRMVALYDYDPRESSPNVDVEAELTFCTGDIITVFGEIDEDGFYYGELNGQKGLVPSNFLEEVPDDVEVYLSDAPSHYSQDTPVRAKAKRVSGPRGPPARPRAARPTQPLLGLFHLGRTTKTLNFSLPFRTARSAPPPTVHLHSGSPTSSMGTGSPGRGREMSSKKKKGLLSKGKKLLKRLGARNALCTPPAWLRRGQSCAPSVARRLSPGPWEARLARGLRLPGVPLPGLPVSVRFPARCPARHTGTGSPQPASQVPTPHTRLLEEVPVLGPHGCSQPEPVSPLLSHWGRGLLPGRPGCPTTQGSPTHACPPPLLPVDSSLAAPPVEATWLLLPPEPAVWGSGVVAGRAGAVPRTVWNGEPRAPEAGQREDCRVSRLYPPPPLAQVAGEGAAGCPPLVGTVGTTGCREVAVGWRDWGQTLGLKPTRRWPQDCFLQGPGQAGRLAPPPARLWVTISLPVDTSSLLTSLRCGPGPLTKAAQEEDGHCREAGLLLSTRHAMPWQAVGVCRDCSPSTGMPQHEPSGLGPPACTHTKNKHPTPKSPLVAGRALVAAIASLRKLQLEAKQGKGPEQRAKNNIVSSGNWRRPEGRGGTGRPHVSRPSARGGDVGWTALPSVRHLQATPPTLALQHFQRLQNAGRGAQASQCRELLTAPRGLESRSDTVTAFENEMVPFDCLIMWKEKGYTAI